MPSPVKPSTSASAGAAASSSAPSEPRWGRVLIAGGTDWPVIGRKGTKVSEEAPDLVEPHILRSLSNVRVASIYSSSIAASFVAIDTAGGAWLFGRNEASNLGITSTGSGGTAEGFIPETQPRYLTPHRLGHERADAKFVFAILGRSHTVLVDEDGAVYGAGDNRHGQLGLSPKAKLGVSGFTRIDSCRHLRVKSGSAGASFTVLLTKEGKLFALGSGEHGQLGNGRTGEHIAKANTVAFEKADEPMAVGGELSGKKITMVASGTAHSCALDEDGMVYTWGYNGYCRLGLTDQKDRLVPTIVPQFARENKLLRAKFVSCGPANTSVIDNSSIFYIAGKFKSSGPGGGGEPNTTFKFLQDIASCKVFKAHSGGASHFALAQDHTNDALTLSIAFGQGTIHSELGLGPEEAKTSTRPAKINPLNGLAVFDVAAGLHTTLFLCEPSDAYAELPRHEPLETADECFVCGAIDDEQPGVVCDMCEKPFHLACLTPALAAQPEEPEWFCPDHETAHALQSVEFLHADELNAVAAKSGSTGKGKRPAPAAAAKGGAKKRK